MKLKLPYLTATGCPPFNFKCLGSSFDFRVSTFVFRLSTFDYLWRAGVHHPPLPGALVAPSRFRLYLLLVPHKRMPPLSLTQKSHRLSVISHQSVLVQPACFLVSFKNDRAAPLRSTIHSPYLLYCPMTNKYNG